MIRRPGRVSRLADLPIFVFVLVLTSAFASVAHVSILLYILICHGSAHRCVLTYCPLVFGSWPLCSAAAALLIIH